MKASGLMESSFRASESGNAVKQRIRNSVALQQNGKTQEKNPAGMPLVMEDVEEGLIIFDQHGCMESMNAEVERIFGYMVSEVLPENLMLLFSTADHEWLNKGTLHFLRTWEAQGKGVGYQLRGRRKDGSTFPLQLTIHHMLLAHRFRYVAVIRALASQDRTSACQTTTKDLLHEVANVSTEGNSTLNCLKKICEGLEWEAGRFWHVDTTLNILRCDEIWHAPWANLETFAAQSRNLPISLDTGLLGRVYKSGLPQWTDDIVEYSTCLSASRAAEDGLHTRFGFPVKVGREVIGIIEFLRLEIRPYDKHEFAMLTAACGLMAQFIAGNYVECIRQRLEMRNAEIAKTESLWTLALGISHDFNNILTAINGFTDLTLLGLPPDSPLKSKLQEILRAGKRGQGLVQQILDYPRNSQKNCQPTQLEPVIKEVLDQVHVTLSRNIQIQKHLEAGPGLVMCDPTQIHQVAMNLLRNAEQAMEATGGILEVTLESVQIKEKLVAFPQAVHPGPYLRLTVQDTGCGIPRENLEKIFHLSFTTRGTKGGAGLGLANTYRIIVSVGGALVIESSVGRGSTFTVYLPLMRNYPYQ